MREKITLLLCENDHMKEQDLVDGENAPNVFTSFNLEECRGLRYKMNDFLCRFLCEDTTMMEKVINELQSRSEHSDGKNSGSPNLPPEISISMFSKTPSSPNRSPPRSPRNTNLLSPRSLNLLSRQSASPSHFLMPSVPSMSLSGSSVRTSKGSDDKTHVPTFFDPDNELEARIEKHSDELDEIHSLFNEHKDQPFNANDFILVCKNFCGFPSFFTAPLIRRILSLWKRSPDCNVGDANMSLDQIEDLLIRKDQFIYFWKHELCGFSERERGFRLIKKIDEDEIVSSDFIPYLNELLTFHPGLEFLESTREFQDKYTRTVIARILYEVNTSRTGNITRREFIKSDFIDICHIVDEEYDINAVHRYFSYEHFYVLYCKFWELDTDHDFFITQKDLLRHDGYVLTPAIVERIFQQPVYPFMSRLRDKMSYEDFVFFFLAEEDKGNPISLDYWFRCVDIDGDGVIRRWEMEHFYAQQFQRLKSYGHEMIPFSDILCQLVDCVHPEVESEFRYTDFIQPHCIQISGVVFNVLFNLNKFVAFEQRDSAAIRQMHENPTMTDWDRFAQVEYRRLASADEENDLEEEEFGYWDSSRNDSVLDELSENDSDVA